MSDTILLGTHRWTKKEAKELLYWLDDVTNRPWPPTVSSLSRGYGDRLEWSPSKYGELRVHLCWGHGMLLSADIAALRAFVKVATVDEQPET